VIEPSCRFYPGEGRPRRIEAQTHDGGAAFLLESSHPNQASFAQPGERQLLRAAIESATREVTMAWRYELREDNRLIEMRSGFETAQLAQYAGERARGMVANIIPEKRIEIVIANNADYIDVRGRTVGKS
jgi:hypothetical protein